MKLPNFFLVGVTKAGTSSIHSWLSSHPDVFVPGRKELHFYCGCPSRLKFISDLAAYKAVFQAAPPTAMIVGEASPCYSYYPSVAQRLVRDWADGRAIISLRDPVERFWSHYLMNSWYHSDAPAAIDIVKAWESGNADNTAVDDIVGSGMYHNQLKRLLEAFGPERFMVTTLEELSTDPVAVMSSVFTFLGLRDAQIDLSVHEKAYAEPRNRVSKAILRQGVLRRWATKHVPHRVRITVKYRLLGDITRRPQPPADLVERLRTLYTADVAATSELLGRAFPWPHFPSSMSI